MTEECSALLATLHKRSGEAAYAEFVGCPHCLNDVRPVCNEPTWLPKEECLTWVANQEPSFPCGAEHVSTARLKVDITFGTLHMYEDIHLSIEPTPFAAGAFGVVSRAQRAGETVAVKELSPNKARAFLARRQGKEPEPADEKETRFAFEEFQHEGEISKSWRPQLDRNKTNYSNRLFSTKTLMASLF